MFSPELSLSMMLMAHWKFMNCLIPKTFHHPSFAMAVAHHEFVEELKEMAQMHSSYHQSLLFYLLVDNNTTFPHTGDGEYKLHFSASE